MSAVSAESAMRERVRPFLPGGHSRLTDGERWLLHTRGAWEIAGASTFGRGAWEVPGASESAKWAACGFPGGPTPARAACDAPGAPNFELLGAWSVPGAPAAGSAARRARVAAGRPNSERRLRWARRADEEKGRLEAPGRPEGVWAAWKLAGAPNSTGNMAPGHPVHVAATASLPVSTETLRPPRCSSAQFVAHTRTCVVSTRRVQPRNCKRKTAARCETTSRSCASAWRKS